MTLKERENPAIINSSRKKRIAAGCGQTVVDVNRILKQFEKSGAVKSGRGRIEVVNPDLLPS